MCNETTGGGQSFSPDTETICAVRRLTQEWAWTATVDNDDRQLVERCLRGDQGAYNQLVEQHARMVGTVIWRAVGRQDVVEDLTQETFLRVFRGLPAFGARARVSTWIYTIAHRVALDHLRLVSRRRERAQDWADMEGTLARVPSSEPTPEAALARGEFEALVRLHVAELPDNYRIPLGYAAIDGLDYATIATMLDVPIGTAKTLVHRGRQLLRDRIESACALKPNT